MIWKNKRIKKLELQLINLNNKVDKIIENINLEKTEYTPKVEAVVRIPNKDGTYRYVEATSKNSAKLNEIIQKGNYHG